MADLTVTNNPLVKERFLLEKHLCVFVDGSLIDVLNKVRDYVHIGHSLISHPLSGSIKPGETPYKTVVLTGAKGSGVDNNSVDLDSLEIIENAVIAAKKFKIREYPKEILEKVQKDFQLIDYTLIFGEHKK